MTKSNKINTKTNKPIVESKISSPSLSRGGTKAKNNLDMDHLMRSSNESGAQTKVVNDYGSIDDTKPKKETENE